MDARGKVITAALVWCNGTFEENFQIRTDERGNITAMGRMIALPHEEVIDLGNKALLPGFVNAHSHSFHREMRGRSQIGSTSSDSFWKWRKDMYSIAEDIDEKLIYEYALATFREMLSAGITTVGEFHYVHHGEDQFSLDSAILEAARDAGIRIALIQTFYRRAGFDSPPLVEAQKKFVSSVKNFTESCEKLQVVAGDLQTIAVAAHSLRAVSIDECNELAEWCSTKHLPMHIHVEEQRQEIEQCLNSTSRTPSDLLLSGPASRVVPLTAVHCTFTTQETMERLGAASVHVCICPLTEGYLGDGIPNIVEESKICLGTDCNNRISILEEMRMLAYCQHMKFSCRNVCGLDANKLLRIATENGASSLGLKLVGNLKEGMQLDSVVFNLDSPRITKPLDQLLDAIIFGAGNEDIAATLVSGKFVYSRQS